MNLNEEKSEAAHFDQLATKYDSNYKYKNDFFRYKRDKKVSQCVRFVKSSRRELNNILEIGAGTGEYTIEIAKRFSKANILGIDISKNILKVAREKSRKFKNIKYKQMSAYKLEIPNNTQDVVIGFYILHHLNDLDKVFSEVARVLKPGGVAYFMEPNLLNPYVFLVKNVPWLKKRAGDSPDETAINPLTLKKHIGHELNLMHIKTSEFIIPIRYINSTSLKKLDNQFNKFETIPIVKYVGGSVEICLAKK